MLPLAATCSAFSLAAFCEADEKSTEGPNEAPVDGFPQCGCSNATTLWHLNAAGWAPSTASKADFSGTTASGGAKRSMWMLTPTRFAAAFVGEVIAAPPERHLLGSKCTLWFDKPW